MLHWLFTARNRHSTADSEMYTARIRGKSLNFLYKFVIFCAMLIDIYMFNVNNDNVIM